MKCPLQIQIFNKEMKKIRLYASAAFIATMGMISCSCSNESDDKQVPPDPVEENEPFAGTWVTNVASNALTSREEIVKTVEACADSRINNIFVVVWNNGRTIYPSKVMKDLIGIEISEKFAERDPLKEMIEEAHKMNIKVHAWMEYGFAASNNRNGGEIIAAKPEWKALDAEGKLLTKNGFEWMNAMLPEVQDFMTSLAVEIATNYDVDGIQGDDRLPAMPSTGGYDDYTKKLYSDEHNGAEPPSDYKNEEWVNWRAAKLTEFMGRFYAAVKKVKPGIMVSNAPSVHPWAKNEYLQDWPSWLEKGYTDIVIPQVYRYDIDAYNATLEQQLKYLPAKDRGKFYPGMLIQNGDYNPSEEFLTKMIETNRRNGIAGESFWFYEGVKKFPEFFSTYHK